MKLIACADPEEKGVLTSLGISQMVIDVHRSTSTDPLQKKLDHLGPIASPGRFVQPSVKYVED